MQLTSLVAAGLAVSTTNAFLLPFPAEDVENDVVNALPVPIEVQEVKVPSTAESRALKLECPGCPVPAPRKHHKDAKVKTDIPSHLELDFSIDHAADADRLMLNGFELYPNADPMSYTLGAKLLPNEPHAKHGKGRKGPGHKKHGDQEKPESHKKHDDKKHDDEKPEDKKHEDKKHDEEHDKEHDEMKRFSHGKHHHHEPEALPLGFGLSAKTAAKNEEDNMELILVDLQVIEVGNTFVNGIPKVEVSLVKTPEGGLMIGEVLTAESETLHATPMADLLQEDCTTLLCKWRAIVMQQVARLRAHKHCAGHHAGHAIGQTEEAEEGHKQPSHDMHHHMHHGHRSWAHLLKNIAAHILLPIAIGIVAGVSASILGMLVGTAIVCLWRTFVRPAGTRRHRHGHSVHKAAQHETAPVEEKSGLMAAYQEEAEAPPAYLEEGVTEDKEVVNV